jgi:hypothetical protein
MPLKSEIFQSRVHETLRGNQVSARRGTGESEVAGRAEHRRRRTWIEANSGSVQRLVHAEGAGNIPHLSRPCTRLRQPDTAHPNRSHVINHPLPIEVLLAIIPITASERTARGSG